MTPVESAIVMDMLWTCENPPEFEVEIRETMEVRVGVLDPTADLRGGCMGPVRKRRPRGNRGCRRAKAEDGVSRSRWSRARGTGTEME